MGMLESIYLKHTSIKEQIKQLLKRDLWMNPEKCLEVVLKYERV